MAYLQMRNITKAFGSVEANDHVDLDVERGEIHALLGENGAGKSTLMNVLYGMYDSFQGSIQLDGKPLHIRNPKDAIANGIVSDTIMVLYKGRNMGIVQGDQASTKELGLKMAGIQSE